MLCNNVWSPYYKWKIYQAKWKLLHSSTATSALLKYTTDHEKGWLINYKKHSGKTTYNLLIGGGTGRDAASL